MQFAWNYLNINNTNYDAIYTIGKDCSKRIILYSDGKNENDQNERNEIQAYLKSAMNEMTPKSKKAQKNITDAIEFLDQLMAEASATESQ